MVYDNHDERIPYYDLFLYRRDLERIPSPELPEGYRFAFYQTGDRDDWITIEISAKEVSSYEEGLNIWNLYYANNEKELANRMVFVVNSKGEKVATASAYYDVYGEDPSGAGWLHWVAVRRDHQGRGLSKPLICHTLAVLRDIGYTHVKIHTQTTTWLACRIYLDLGFLPIPENADKNRAGWNIEKTLTNHPALKEFDYVDLI